MDTITARPDPHLTPKGRPCSDATRYALTVAVWKANRPEAPSR